MGRVLVHGEKGSELVFGDQADRVGVHIRLPTKRTRSRPLLITRHCILVKPQGGKACVCELTEPLDLTQPTISHHLKILVDAGIFTRDKRGVWAYYAFVPAAMDALSAVLSTGAQPVSA